MSKFYAKFFDLTGTCSRFYLLRFQAKPISSSSSSSSSTSLSSVPSHEHIAHLITEQISHSQALQTFRWASKLPNFTHSQSTYRALIHKLCTFRQFDLVKELLDEMPTSIGSPPDESIFLTIIRGLGRAKMVKEAIKVLDLVSKFQKDPSLKVCNSILDVLVKEDINLARAFFRDKMMKCGIQGDNYTFGILMKGLCLTNRISDGFKLLQLMKSRGITPNTVVYNTLIHGLCKTGKLGIGRGRSLMSEMAEPNEVTFNILISAYCKERDLIQSLVLLEKSFSLGFVPDVIPVTKIVQLLCGEGRVMEAVEILERVEERGGSVDVVAYNALIRGFCRIGKTNLGFRFLKEMERKGCLPNVHTYNELIAGLCESKEYDLALEQFNDMTRDGISPNFVTYDTLIRGLCSGRRIGDGLNILDQMEEERRGSGGQISPYNSIIYGFYKENRLVEALEFLTKMGSFFPSAVHRSKKILGFCKDNCIGEAKQVYDQMIAEGGLPSAVVYSDLIHGLCQVGDIREAFELINEMVDHGYFPISSTFNVLISEFCKQGKVESASKLLKEMVDRGCLPDVGSYNPLIDTFCKKGDFHGALKLQLQMVEKGITPNYYTWTSLLLFLSQQIKWRKQEIFVHK
ncbi:pentatricopeptide repeat-containing protein At2g17525, mitochondrial [Papaver somniferum]|uniref:pentatricopeptide repeat-containing protein At2g17525, mitochondrial n=1 Tax=Papaver somniferum TaxID=3469 RepID=UPI000E6F9A53|nr:pentatricopeptide repeat-containing protein At2g17525, mitochondrial [Papaver somniferum]